MKEAELLALLEQDLESIPLRADWDGFTAEFNIDLPHDYKVLVDSCDSIELFSFVFLVNPFAEDGSFPRQNNPMIDFYREGIEYYEGKELDTIFPIGGTENGSEIWLVRENGAWSIAIADRHWMQLEEYEMGLPQFLRKFILGEIRPEQFPEVILKRQGWPLLQK